MSVTQAATQEYSLEETKALSGKESYDYQHVLRLSRRIDSVICFRGFLTDKNESYDWDFITESLRDPVSVFVQFRDGGGFQWTWDFVNPENDTCCYMDVDKAGFQECMTILEEKIAEDWTQVEDAVLDRFDIVEFSRQIKLRRG